MSTPVCLTPYSQTGPSNNWSVSAWYIGNGVYVCDDDSYGSWCVVRRDVDVDESGDVLHVTDSPEDALSFALSL